MLRKKITIWVAVADGSGYRIFSCKKLGANLALVHEAQNPDYDLPTHEMGTDRPGRSQAAPGQGRHALDNKADWHTEAGLNFAKTLGSLLKNRFKDKAFQKLLVIAPSKILGEIRGQVPEKALGRNYADLDKDLTGLSEHELKGYLARFVPERRL